MENVKKVITDRPEMKLVGISVRTNNAHIFEADPTTNPIALTVQKYFHQGLPANIQNKKTPGITYCAYTDYESDYNGDYTYFIGEEVTSFEDVPEGMTTHTIPAQTYAKFTSDSGPMPKVCVELWQKIWFMEQQNQMEKRRYGTDFEVYDERAADHANVTLDIYIALKK
ncbi:MAG: GyrI-like domain-containing protein [Alphaproteobacteria bacterium]|nr:GyrI-like domain-containing protein [Alphaproteobacteria bacterium]